MNILLFDFKCTLFTIYFKRLILDMKAFISQSGRLPPQAGLHVAAAAAVVAAAAAAVAAEAAEGGNHQ